jgi:type VI secretion system secreted protein VgrG
MLARKANEAQFLFYCGNLKAETFHVADFRGRDCVSSPYDFSITLTSPSPDIRPDDVINKQATLYVYRDGEYFPYSGVVCEFRFVDRSTDFSTYSVRLVPRLWLLSLNVQTRVFQKTSVDKIVKKVLDDANLTNYCTMDLGGPYPQREYVVQYQESDLNFISRLMERAGIWYFFKESPLVPEEVDGVGVEAMVVSDKPGSFEYVSGESTILFRSHSGLDEGVDQEEKEDVFRVAYDRRVVAKNVRLKNYNYRAPEVDVSGSAAIGTGDTGEVYAYGGQYRNTDEARKAADVAAGQISTGQTTVHGSGRCRGFRAGRRFTLTEHFRSDCNDKYLICEVTHTGAHGAPRGGQGVFTYTNEFVAIPSSQVNAFRPAARSRVPRIHGVVTAPIEANGSAYAALDDMGRYKVRMPFDLSGSRNYEGSKYVRLAQPYSGSNYGVHFPSHEGAEMVLACIDGDPDKPIGVGTVPNANTVSPVVGSNKEQSVIKTAGNNEIVLDDTDGKQKMHLTTSAKHTISMDDENRSVTVKSAGDNKVLIDDTGKRVAVNADKHQVVLSYGDSGKGVFISTADGHGIRIDDENKCITVVTAGGQKVHLDDSGGKLTVADGGNNTITMEQNGSMAIDCSQKLDINVTSDLTIKAANVKIQASGGIEAKGNSDVKLSGMNFEAKGDMNAKVEGGMSAEVSGMMAKVEGKTMADFKGGAKTTLTGGVVMIN